MQIITLAAALLCGCQSTKIDAAGNPPVGYGVLPKPPVPF